jgi:hypothetical protein
MSDTTVTIAGNLTDTPELRFTAGGAALANFTLAVTPRVKDGDGWRDGETLFLRCTAWRAWPSTWPSWPRATGCWSTAACASGPGRPRTASAAPWSRSRSRRPAPRCGGRPPSPNAPPRPPTTRPSPTSSEAGAAVTRPGLAHHNPWRPDAPCTLPDPPAGGAALAARLVGRLLPGLRHELGRSRDQEQAEHAGQRRRCPICQPTYQQAQGVA